MSATMPSSNFRLLPFIAMLAGIVLLAWLVGALLGLWPLLPSFSGLAPQPQSYAGTGISRVGPITVSYVDGKQGLAILVWCHISGQAGGSSGNSTSGGAGSAEYASTVRAAARHTARRSAYGRRRGPWYWPSDRTRTSPRYRLA